MGLRHVRQEDLSWLERSCADPEVRGPFLGSRMISPHQTAQTWRDNGCSSPEFERLIVCDLADERICGDVGHFPSCRYSSSREIGWTLTEVGLRGQGLATEAASLLVDYLFDNWQINRLQCAMSVYNHASRRVAEKCGFRHEGVMRGFAFVGGKYVDCHLLSLLRSEWEEAKEPEPRK